MAGPGYRGGDLPEAADHNIVPEEDLALQRKRSTRRRTAVKGTELMLVDQGSLTPKHRALLGLAVAGGVFIEIAW